MATLPGFANTAAGVALANPSVPRPGQTAGAAQTADSAPPKANAAPSINKNIAIGLVESLNNTEAELVKNGVFEQANQYSIEFAPEALGDSRVTKGGKPNKTKVPMQQTKKPSDVINPESNSADYSVRTFDYQAGTPIVLILNEILKNSTYIADQAKLINDEVTGLPKEQKPLGNLAWYKISVQTTAILPFDRKRGDFAKKIKYVISTYPINSMISEYFPEGKIRGRHKSYKYWFTGQNAQVLKFEQEFNYLYHQTFTNPDVLAETRRANNRELPPRREYQAAVAASNTQGAEKQANAIGASAADYLYSKSDISNCTLTIVGDPAWIQQGEAATGVSGKNFDFSPFNADGGINFDAQEIIFDVQWNPGVDYDLTGTGLANPNVAAKPQAIYTYKASEVTSRFFKGKFEQVLTGTFIDLLEPAPVSTNVTNDRQTPSTNNAGVRPLPQTLTFAERLKSSVTNPTPTSSLAKGVQQILSPATNGDNLSDNALRGTPIYNQVRRGGGTDAAALAAARTASSAGTNNYSGSALPGIRVPNQLIAKDQ
jgi:hypothetical protein